MDLLRHTEQSLQAVPATGVIVVAVSGGRDSMTLLSILAALLPPSRLVVAHCNHALRGTESQEDAALVARSASRLGLRYAETTGTGAHRDELRLREERWAFLESIAAQHNAVAIATAHHGADQLETLLMRLLRGTGARGLGGIRARDGLRWRPWLAVAPATIETWARSHAVLWREDRSNAQTAYTRNALRHSVLPALLEESERHGGTEAFFQRLAETCRSTAELVETSDQARLGDLSATTTPFFLRYSSEHFDKKDATLDALAVHLGAPLLREQRARALRASGVRATWGNGLQWQQSCGYDYVTTPKMRATLAQWRTDTQAAFDRGEATTPFPLRWATTADSRGQWRLPLAGDRYGRHKLKDHWLRARVPQPEREIQVVLADKNFVLWTATDPVSELAKHDGFPFAPTY